MNLVGVRWLGRNEVCAAAALALATSLSIEGCTLDNPGISPPQGVVNFPVALELSEEEGGAKPRFLYVVNANIDLRYNAGSVQTYDLDEIERRINRDGCRALGDAGAPVEDASVDAGAADAGSDDASTDASTSDGATDDASVGEGGLAEAGLDAAATLTRVVPTVSQAEQVDSQRGILCDGRSTRSDNESVCCFGNLDVLRDLRRCRGEEGCTDELLIDSFASGIAIAPSGNALYVPVRSKSRLMYVDVDDGELSCEGVEHCRRGPVYGTEPRVGTLEQPTHPLAVVAGELSEIYSGSAQELGSIELQSGAPADLSTPFVAMTHENGSVSLFTAGASGVPQLENVYASGLTRAVGLAKDPIAKLLYVTSAEAALVARAGLRAVCQGGRDGTGDDACPAGNLFLQLATSTSIQSAGADLSQFYDVRDVVVDPRPVAAGQPRRIYALLRGRDPSRSSVTNLNSVIIFEVPARTEDGSAIRAVDEVRLGEGLNRLVQATIGGRYLLFASGYRQRVISVIDPDAPKKLIEGIGEFQGPYDMRVDSQRELLYVADYGASVVRVVDLSGLRDRTRPRPRIVGTLGSPYFSGSIQ